MRPINFLALASALILAPTAGLIAQPERDDFDIVKVQIRSNRQALVAENLLLSVSENQVFWPIYRAFQTERTALVDRRIELLREFRDNFDGISEEQAKQMLDIYFELQEDFLQLRKKYLQEFRKVLVRRPVVELT